MSKLRQLNLIRSKHRIQSKIFAFRTKHLKSFGIFVLAAMLVVTLLQSANIFAQSQQTKNAVIGSASQALADLKQAGELASQKDFAGAAQALALAQQNFSHARSDIQSLGVFLNSFTSQGKQANLLLDAGQAASLAGENLDSSLQQFGQLKINAAGFAADQGFYQTVGSANAYLLKAENYLQLANSDLASVDQNVLPDSVKYSFGSYKQQLAVLVQGLGQIHDLIDLFQQFIGPGQKNILVLFENNREMRPTGGFIGTYGYFRLNDGKITSQKISSIYDLDGQLRDKIAPPGAFHDLTDHWGLRDSNWFADFSQSAQKANLFYEKEGGETPDAVVALTPDLFVDLLNITGPVAMPQYNVVLSADNFRDEVQLATSFNYDLQANTPKQMLADLAVLLIQRLAQLPGASRAAVVFALLKNLSEKNILFYDRDQSIESKFQQYNWAGAVASTDKDYLEVVNSNLGGRKTDLNISQNLDLSSALQPDGSIINTITYVRTQSQDLVLPDSPNIDYVRFIVPKGSQFVSASGFTQRQYYLSDGSGYPQNNQPFQIDPDLAAIDANSVIDTQTGTIITNGSAKTEFANWIETQPGQRVTVMISYRLPFKISDGNTFSLLFQKQPGSAPIDFNYQAQLGSRIAWYTPDDLSLSGQTISYQTSLNSDLFIGAVLDR